MKEIMTVMVFGYLILRTVPTFVSAHMFCTSRKAWFKRHAHAGLTWRNQLRYQVHN